MERASRQGTIYAIVLVVVVTALTLRRWRETLLALLPLVLGLVWTLGLMYFFDRSEEHTSELQSRLHLVCRLLLEKKKNIMITLASIDLSTCMGGILTNLVCRSRVRLVTTA